MQNVKSKLGAGVGVVVALVVFGLSAVASATPTVKDQVTTMATNGFGEAVPILLAVATAAVALAVAGFGASKVIRAIKGGGRV